jgi:hypothetical protein
MMNPLTKVESRDLARKIVETGLVTYSQPHALEMMKKRGITTADCLLVLRRGNAKEPEWENGRWRYQFVTGKLTVVVEFVNQMHLRVITCWG